MFCDGRPMAPPEGKRCHRKAGRARYTYDAPGKAALPDSYPTYNLASR